MKERAKKYHITLKVSGKYCGIHSGKTSELALDAYAVSRGHSNFARMAEHFEHDPQHRVRSEHYEVSRVSK